MDRVEREALASAIDTPWGRATLATEFPVRGHDQQNAEGITIATEFGRAEASFHIDTDDERALGMLRVVLLGGYASPVAMFGQAERRGESTLVVDGVAYGWRAQTRFDLAGTGPGPVEVMLVDGRGPWIRDSADIEERVRTAVVDTFALAVEADPTVMPRIYAELTQRHLADLDDDIEQAQRQLEAMRAHRDLVAGKIAEAIQRADSPAGASFAPRA